MTDAERSQLDYFRAEVRSLRADLAWETRARTRLSRCNRALIAFAVLVALLALLAR